MPHRLKQRQEKIQNKRKQTPWREFVKEICGRKGMNYRRNNDILSTFPISNRIKNIVSVKDFHSQQNELEKYGIAYSGDFFNDFFKLQQDSPSPALIHYHGCENCKYADTTKESNNVYLSTTVIRNCENILYSIDVRYDSRNIINTVNILKYCNNVYMSNGIINSLNIFYSKYIKDSHDIRCSSNLLGCSECIKCKNLQNQSYCINNKKYEKKEYFAKKKEILSRKEKFIKRYSDLKEYGIVHNSIQSSGSLIYDSENVKNGYFVYGLKNGRNVIMSGSEDNDEDYYDNFIVGRSQGFYGILNSGGFSQNCYLGVNIDQSSNIFYGINIDTCSYCLGCIGLKNKSYCILNKQYTKEERYDKVDEIFTQMEKDGTLGKFFPGSMNPFYFNDTAAYLIDDSFTKEEVEAEGYLRRDEKVKVDIPEGAEVVYTQAGSNEVSQLDDYQGRKVNGKFYSLSDIGNKTPKAESGAERRINPEILKKVIQDKEGNYYKIVKMEYDFLMKHELPLPKLHWLDRIKLGFKFK